MRVNVTADQVRSAFDAVKDDPSFDESRGLVERGHLPVEMIRYHGDYRALRAG